MREICTPGSAWGDEIKWPCLLGERCSRKRCTLSGSARATVVKTRPYHPVRSVGRGLAQESVKGDVMVVRYADDWWWVSSTERKPSNS